MPAVAADMYLKKLCRSWVRFGDRIVEFQTPNGFYTAHIAAVYLGEIIIKNMPYPLWNLVSLLV